MNIVIGRGKNRHVYELPGGGFMKLAASKEPENYNDLHANVCRLLRIPVSPTLNAAVLSYDS